MNIKNEEQEAAATEHNRKAIWILGGLLALGLVIISVLPLGIRYGLQQALLKGGLDQVEIHDIDFNPFTGVMVLDRLSARLADQNVLRIDNAMVRVAWFPLFSKQIKVETIDLSDATITVRRQNDGRLRTGGYLLGAEPDAKPASPPERTASPWGVGAEGLQLSGLEIRYQDLGLNIVLEIDEARLSPLRSWDPDGSGELSLKGRINDAPLALQAALQPFAGTPRYQVQLKLDGLNLEEVQPLLPPTINQLSGRLYSDSSLTLNMGNEGTLAASQTGTLTLTDHRLETAGQQLSQGKLEWDGETRFESAGETMQLNLDGRLSGQQVGAILPEQNWQLGLDNLQSQVQLRYGSGQPLDLALDTAIELDGLRLTRPDQQYEVTRIEKLKLDGIRLEGTEQARAKLVVASGFHLGHQADLQDPAQLLDAAGIQVAGLRWSAADGTAIESVRVDQLKGDIVRGQDGNWPLLDPLLQSGGTGDETAASEQPSEAAPSPGILIDEITISKDSAIRFRDHTTAPAFDTTFNVETLQLAALNSRQPEQASPFTLKGKTDKYSTIDLKGDLFPFQAKPTFTLDGKLSSVPLPALSAYTRRVLGYTLSSGTLDADIQVKANQAELSGENKLLIRNLTVKPHKAAGEAQLDQQFKVPLDTALSMLRDDKNNIRLTLPVSGNLDDPSLDISDAINTALGKAMKSAAVNYLSYALQPYGAILGAVQLTGKAINAVRLEPLEFEPGEPRWPDDQQPYLDKIGKLMGDRPKVSIRLCGMAVEADRAALVAAATAEQAAAGEKAKPKEPPPPPEISDQQLEALAARRAEAIKDQLVDKGTIAAERLFLCHPELDREAGGKPRVELLI